MTLRRQAQGAHLAFATSRAHAGLIADDLYAVAVCEARGMRVSAAVWDDPHVPWSAFDAVVVRSTWDYYHRLDEFEDWLTALEASGARVWNPVSLLRWNANKRYLDALAQRGVTTVPTAWVTPAKVSSIAAIMEERGWDDVVVKPAVSATAHGTHRVRRADVATMLPELLRESTGELLIQPFLPEIQSAGEWSIIFLGGSYSHSVRKRPASGDFRVQTEFGGSSGSEPAPRTVIEAAAAVLEFVDGPWLYARVDGIETGHGFLLMELEMLEPMLFFGSDPHAPLRFARALEDLIAAGSPAPRSPSAAPPR